MATMLEILSAAGCISADIATQVTRQYAIITGNSKKTNLTNNLAYLREEVLKELNVEAAMRGCNAVIGVSFSTITLDTQSILRGDNSNQPYVVVMTAVGTAVKVAKA